MAQHPAIEVRFYNAEGTQRRSLFGVKLASARWKSTRYGNYADADFTLSGNVFNLTQDSSPSGIQPIRENDRVRVYATPEGESPQLRWSGYVSAVTRSVGAPNQVRVTALGFYSKLSVVPVDGRFISPVSVDISQAFASFAYTEALGAYPDLTVDIRASSLGVSVSVVDAFNKTLSGTFSDLSAQFGGIAVYGCDEQAGELGARVVDRLFLREISSLTDPTYTIPVPGKVRGAAVSLADGGLDISRMVNILSITGTTPTWPNYLSEACLGNCGFERPVFSNEASNQLLTDTSFEQSILSPWTFDAGATQKNAIIEGVPARTGTSYIELDAVGEGVRRTITTPLTAGYTLLVGIYSRRENGNFGGTVRLRVQFKNGGLDVGAPQDRTFSPQSVYWLTVSEEFLIPSGVTGFEVSYQMTAGGGSGQGINLDDAFAFLTFVRQDGWNLVTEGSAVRNTRDFAHTASRREGRYSFRFDVSASDADGNDAYLQPQGKFAVTPGALLEFGIDIRAWTGETNGKLRLDFRFYKEDGSEVSGSGVLTVFAAGTINETWRQIRTNATVPTTAALCLVRVTLRGNNRLYLDRAYVRDTAAPTVVFEGVVEREWIGDGPYRATFTTEDDAFISEPYSESIPTYGKRYLSIDSDAVADYAGALVLARAYFDVYALPLAHPTLTIEGSPLTFSCGETIRIAGDAGAWLGQPPATGEPSRAFAITEIEETADRVGKVTTTLFMEVEPPTMERMVARIFEKQRKRGSGGGVSSFATPSAGGGGGASASLSLPVSVANGGTAGTTAADARTNLGLGSGLSVTIPLAKLTPAGANGSATFSNGVLTARVDPT